MFAEAQFRWEDLNKWIWTRTRYVHTLCVCLFMTYLNVIHRHILVLESHSDIPCACILALRAIQVSKSPFRTVQNLVLQFTFFYFNLLSFTLIYFLSLLFTFIYFLLVELPSSYFYLLLFTFIYLTLYSNSNFLRIWIYVYCV